MLTDEYTADTSFMHVSFTVNLKAGFTERAYYLN